MRAQFEMRKMIMLKKKQQKMYTSRDVFSRRLQGDLNQDLDKNLDARGSDGKERKHKIVPVNIEKLEPIPAQTIIVDLNPRPKLDKKKLKKSRS